MDQNGSGTVSFNEFVAATIDARGQDIKQINQAYRLLDKDQKGFINVEDVTTLLSTGISMSFNEVEGNTPTSVDMEELQSLMRQRVIERAQQTILDADLDMDGVVSYKEFLYAIADLPKTVSTGHNSLLGQGISMHKSL